MIIVPLASLYCPTACGVRPCLTMSAKLPPPTTVFIVVSNPAVLMPACV